MTLTQRLAMALTLASLMAVAVGVRSFDLLGGAPWTAFSPAGPGQLTGQARPRGSAARLGFGTRTEPTIEDLQTRLRANSDDLPGLTALGFGYLQSARESGDPSFYPRAEAAFRRALPLAPTDPNLLTGMGVLALARHDFAAGLEWGQQAVAANPSRSAAYGVVADGQVELGLYDEAITTVQRMIDLRPDQSSYARVSYIRELHGDTAGAAAAMQLSVDSDRPGVEGTEWSRVQLGNLFLTTGKIADAEQAFRTALDFRPGYLHATIGLARAAAARGELDNAIALYLEAERIMPLPDVVVQLADLYRAVGRTADADQQEKLVQAQQRLFAANGVDTDLEMILFDVDRGRDLPGAVARLRALLEKRRGIHVADALAWALYQNGECREAARYADEALRLGTRESLLLYHAARALACDGQIDRARTLISDALALNPRFSVRYSADAAALAAELRKPVAR